MCLWVFPSSWVLIREHSQSAYTMKGRSILSLWFVKLMLEPSSGSSKLQLLLVEKCFDSMCSSKVSSQQETVLLQKGQNLRSLYHPVVQVCSILSSLFCKCSAPVPLHSPPVRDSPYPLDSVGHYRGDAYRFSQHHPPSRY